jgi:hypothetical protein
VRTTVTLDDDLAAKVRGLAQERGISFKDALNTALRSGLSGSVAGRPYRVEPRPMRLRPGIDLDKALRLAAELEDAETIRKLELRK